MKPTHFSGKNGSIHFYLLICLFLSFIGTETLKGQGNSIPGTSRLTKNVQGVHFSRDTAEFHRAYIQFQKEVLKRGGLDLDSLRHFGHQAIIQARKIQYEQGLIRVFLGLGSGYIAKPVVDSAKYYYTLAIGKASAIQDTGLLSLAYSGYGWTLVYDHSDYIGAIENSRMACSLAMTRKDTSLWINTTTKLVKIYFQANRLGEAFKTCTDLQHVCEIRKDTSAQIVNFYMFGSIYARMNMFEKQREMVYRGQAFKTSDNDTSFLYTINLTKSNGFLFARQYDSVLYYSRLNLKFCEQQQAMPNCYANIAKAFLETDQLDSARYYYQLIMDYHRSHNTYIDTYLYLDLGRIEYKSGNKRKALEYYKRAEEDISKPSLPVQAEIYGELYKYYDDEGNIKQALHYHKKYKAWTDSISNQQFGMSVVSYESSLWKERYQLMTSDKEYQTILAQKQRNEKNLAYGGTALILCLTGLGFRRFKKQRVLKSRQEMLKERLRISRELHDEVGSTLSGIAMYSHVAREQLKNGKMKDAEYSLEFMQTSAGEMVTKLSDIVWLINPEQDTIMEMIGRLGEYAKQMARARGMQIGIDLPENLAGIHIPLEARRNIYLFCKEAINNAVKYSLGKKLVLQVKITGERMVFSVSDDGQGFIESIVKPGNGLLSMRKRAEDIGAVFNMESQVNMGTRVELQYKILQ